MAQFKGKEKGIRDSISLRTGLDVPFFRGLNLDVDPGAIAANELQAATNVRLLGGRIECRGGQTKLTESALDGCVWSIDDLPLPTVGLFLTTDNGNPLTDTLDRYNTDITPNYGTVYADATLPTLTGRGSLFVWGKKLIASSAADNGIHEVVLPKRGESGGVSLKLIIQLSSLLATVPTSYAAIPEGGSDILYMGSGSQVLRFDGTLLTTDGTVGAGTMIVGRFHDLPYACGDTTLYRRPPGSNSPATYTPFVLPIASFLCSGMTEWQENLFLVGRNGASTSGPGYILMFNGATVTIGHIPSNTFNARNVSDAIVWNGLLYYVWRELGADPHTWIGTYDGAIWNDIHADLGSTQTSNQLTGYFAIANGLLYVTTIRDETGIGGGGSNSNVLMSSPDGTTWTLVKDIVAADGGANLNHPPFPQVFG